MKRRLIMVVAAVSLLIASAVPTQAWGNCSLFYTVRPGDTLASIARSYGTTFPYLASINGISNPNRIFWGMTICVQTYNPPPPQHTTFYVVQRGDWLSRIAARYGVSLWSLLQVNPLMNPNLIYPGQVITIPL